MDSELQNAFTVKTTALADKIRQKLYELTLSSLQDIANRGIKLAATMFIKVPWDFHSTSTYYGKS
jgi:hypothetical protein